MNDELQFEEKQDKDVLTDFRLLTWVLRIGLPILILSLVFTAFMISLFSPTLMSIGSASMFGLFSLVYLKMVQYGK